MAWNTHWQKKAPLLEAQTFIPSNRLSTAPPQQVKEYIGLAVSVLAWILALPAWKNYPSHYRLKALCSSELTWGHELSLNFFSLAPLALIYQRCRVSFLMFFCDHWNSGTAKKKTKAFLWEKSHLRCIFSLWKRAEINDTTLLKIQWSGN